MTNPLEPLKELARRWREIAAKDWPDYSDCADELESLIPALEAEIAMAVNDAEIEVEHRLQVEIAALKEPMACGHPKACWIEQEPYCGFCAGENPHQSQIRKVDANGYAYHEGIGLGYGSCACFLDDKRGHCTACEDKRLALAAALREAAALAHCEPIVIPANPYPARDVSWEGIVSIGGPSLEEKILALIPPADAKALDAHDAEMRDRAIQSCIEIVEIQRDAGARLVAEKIRALKRGSK